MRSLESGKTKAAIVRSLKTTKSSRSRKTEYYLFDDLDIDAMRGAPSKDEDIRC